LLVDEDSVVVCWCQWFWRDHLLTPTQDGTCNGLQHYAALGGDEEGARHVNLACVPSDDKPQDLYGAVAARILALVKEHATDGVHEVSVLSLLLPPVEQTSGLVLPLTHADSLQL
jgi:hypothetical protein